MVAPLLSCAHNLLTRADQGQPLWKRMRISAGRAEACDRVRPPVAMGGCYWLAQAQATDLPEKAMPQCMAPTAPVGAPPSLRRRCDSIAVGAGSRSGHSRVISAVVIE